MLDVTSSEFSPRVVIDEASFDFRRLSDADVEASLESFSNELEALRDSEHSPALCSLYVSVECREGLELHELLFSRATTVDPDVCRRVALLLDRCSAWDDEPPVGCEPVELPETAIDAYSVGFALTMAVAGRTIGCLVVPTCGRRGLRAVGHGSSAADVLFFAEASGAREVWRRVFTTENVAEREFFSVAAFAFPTLVFHPGLRFGRFDGKYMDVRDRVVRILGALDDHFARVLAECDGRPSDIPAAMGQYGVDLSPESPKTRASHTLMRQRDVDHDGATYRCEWHAKIDRNRNRIHFTLPSAGPEGRILVGIFADHLDV